MEVNDALAMAWKLMEKHELPIKGWRITLDNAKRRFGMCKHGPKIISLSRPLIALNKPQRVEQTILHEIAHALAGGLAG
ncbi:MAG TPA: SprT-like domain-containing protein, partial [Bacteroidia bacterium]|nr:SprT-like domain-containing protein [Bacteroidia bacterium]